LRYPIEIIAILLKIYQFFNDFNHLLLRYDIISDYTIKIIALDLSQYKVGDYYCSKMAFLASISLLIAVIFVNTAIITIGKVNIDTVSKRRKFVPGKYSL
jgi:hypothetical protein